MHTVCMQTWYAAAGTAATPTAGTDRPVPKAGLRLFNPIRYVLEHLVQRLPVEHHVVHDRMFRLLLCTPLLQQPVPH